MARDPMPRNRRRNDDNNVVKTSQKEDDGAGGESDFDDAEGAERMPDETRSFGGDDDNLIALLEQNRNQGSML